VIGSRIDAPFEDRDERDSPTDRPTLLPAAGHPSAIPASKRTRRRWHFCRSTNGRNDRCSEVAPTTPPSTTYELTENGAAFAGLLGEMEGMVGLAECSEGSECATTEESSKCATVR